jgi:DNA invertase Pin-like site-specific DNA recombinase
MRCAIYTRKSSEEGLAQEFNSLDAQRESAEAYILSQRHAGWTLLADRYDDGGYTGANLERPALRRLLADIEAGRIDCVVIYKVDRLSRSLLDFARLMGVFEERGINLVSITQQFNTTASLGRLTLNILLAFAQWEVELVAERTQHKMAAARRKGKWVGGTPVLGYDIAVGGGKLIVNEEEARQVRAIFAVYLEHRAFVPVLHQLEAQGWATKTWTAKNGRPHRGKSFTRHALLRLLNNVIYLGKVRSQGQTYPGEHAAIIEEQVWQRVQEMLQQSRPAVPVEPRVKRLTTEKAIAPIGSLPARLPRITRLLALAVKFEGLIQQGVIKDYTELARLGRISRARVTQIMNLLNLAPDIQAQILSWAAGTPDQVSIPETTLRTLSSEVIWSRQRSRWEEIVRSASRPDARFERPAANLPSSTA